MRLLRYALLADGTSDDVLLEIVDWALRQRDCLGDGEFFPAIRQPGRGRLVERLRDAVEDNGSYDLLFVHRDAENERIDARVNQIQAAVEKAGVAVAHVPIVPVRMTEAWLLFDERLIRRAAANPNGRMRIDVPKPSTLERLADPKSALVKALVTASSTKGRLRRTFDKNYARRRIAQLADDFSALRQLEAFRRFEADLDTALARR